jgi:transcriptional regulator with XRE-family HTH domain
LSSKNSGKKERGTNKAKSRHWKTFRKALKPLLREKGRKQVELARRLGVEPQRITAWLKAPATSGGEERTPGIEHLLEMADFLEVSLDRVLGRTPPGCELLEQLHKQHSAVAHALETILPVKSDEQPGGSAESGRSPTRRNAKKKGQKKRKAP